MRARDIPSVLWLVVADFLHQRTLGATCRELWALLGRRNISVNVDERSAAAKASALGSFVEEVRTMRVACWDLEPSQVPHVVGLVASGRQLRALHLLLRNNPVGKRLGPLLQGLCQLPLLHTLVLDLFCCGITASELQQLAGLKGLPSLQVVSCDLRINQLGTDAAMAVAELQGSPSLRSVTASLSRVQDLGAHALASLKRTPNLQVLYLDLVGSSIGPEGAWALSQLCEAAELQALTLILSGNEVGDLGAHALAALRHTPRLQRLDIRLASNNVGDVGATALVLLADAPLLNCLHLDLRSNVITAAGAKVLLEWVVCRPAKQMEVLLEDNRVCAPMSPGHPGVRALAPPQKRL
eukprot:GGOE01001973.1.p1 GENE.GGOE01001973.1~~GGOE01001973.1.p1  ORF type:complete len:354 (+),score=81.30 GGOE01001973.1:108-1169(+)